MVVTCSSNLLLLPATNDDSSHSQQVERCNMHRIHANEEMPETHVRNIAASE